MSSQDAVAPEKIWKYQLREQLGAGTCGVVYKAYDPYVSREVAIKLAAARDDMKVDATMQSTEIEAGHAFFTEARAAGMLHHPYIVSLYDAGMEGMFKFLVMELVEGKTLKDLCKTAENGLPIEQVVDIGFKCAKALDYAHSKGVLHRDIKPGNIMVGKDGAPKIMDFSIAEIAGPEGGRGGTVGSPLYMAPEQVVGEPLGPPSDLYSLGVVMFYMLTGQLPFSAKKRETLFESIRNEEAPRVDTLRQDAPATLVDVVAKLLEKKPEDRYQSGNELAVVLARLFEKLQAEGQRLARREGHDSMRSLEFFNPFTDPELDEILSAGTLTRFQPGEAIIRETEIDTAFYVLVEGAADVIKGDRAVSRLVAGDCFGEIAFLTEARRTASVVAVEPVVAIRATAALMEQVSRDCQLRFYKVFTETLVARLAHTTAKLSSQP